MEKYEEIAQIFELMNDPSDEALQTVISTAQNHVCPLVRHEAVFALGEMSSSKAIPILKTIAEQDENYVVIHEALMAIGTIGSEKDLDFLKTFLDNEVYEIATSAKIAIQRITEEELNTEQTTKHYIEILENKNSRNKRIHSLFKLMNKGLIKGEDEQAVQAIGKCLLTDPCSIVRHEAGFCLGEIGTENCISLMNKALTTEISPIVIHETLFALGTSGKKSALPSIRQFLDHEDYVISESAKIAEDRILHLKNPYSGARHFANKN